MKLASQWPQSLCWLQLKEILLEIYHDLAYFLRAAPDTLSAHTCSRDFWARFAICLGFSIFGKTSVVGGEAIYILYLSNTGLMGFVLPAGAQST